MGTHITALVVTYNRSELLERCLHSLVSGTRVPDRILVVDNASTDDTAGRLSEYVAQAEGATEWVTDQLAANSGSAGGFSYGLQRAFSLETDAVWIMDDDVVVDGEALAELVDAWSQRPADWYASVAVSDEDGVTFSWSLHLVGGAGPRRVWTRTELDDDVPVRAAFFPFLGMLVPRGALRTVGLPNSEFFIWSDDIDYCYRAREAGHSLWYVPRSVVRHPEAPRKVTRLGPLRYTTVRSPLWKRYFGLRNDIHISIKQKDWRRLARYLLIAGASWFDEPDRRTALPIYALAVRDGFLGRLGRWNPVLDED